MPVSGIKLPRMQRRIAHDTANYNCLRGDIVAHRLADRHPSFRVLGAHLRRDGQIFNQRLYIPGGVSESKSGFTTVGNMST